MARRSKLTSAMSQKICKQIEKGMTIKRACQISGISEATYYEWLNRAEKGESKYIDFSEALKKAEAKAQETLISKLSENDQWQSKAWILERRFASEWGRKENLDITSGGKPVQIQWPKIDTESESE